MKKELPLHEEMPKDLENRILRQASPHLFQLRQHAPVSPLRKWALVFAGAGALTLAIVLVPKGKQEPQSVAGAFDSELLENLDLLREMPHLQNEDLLRRVKGKVEWPKRKKQS